MLANSNTLSSTADRFKNLLPKQPTQKIKKKLYC